MKREKDETCVPLKTTCLRRYCEGKGCLLLLKSGVAAAVWGVIDSVA
jgi:hypothetical protein